MERKFHFKKLLSLLLAALLVISLLPVSTSAASAPVFKITRSFLYENTSGTGVYTYMVKNLTKGQIVNWSVSGAGAKYVTLSRTKSKVTKNVATTKLTIQTNGKLDARNAKVILKAKVTTSTGAEVTTLTTTAKIRISISAVKINTAKIADINALAIGQTYDFDAVRTPTNTTTKVSWYVQDSIGADVSSTMNAVTGKWTPSAAGSYTIIACVGNPDDNPKVIDSVSVTVLPAAREVKTDFTITDNTTAVTFDSASYVQNLNVYVDEVSYAHFRARDTNKNEIKYSTVTYTSSDDNTLIINKDGKITPIKAGTVTITVTGVDGYRTEKSSYQVTVKQARTASYIFLSQSSVKISNANVSGYAVYVTPYVRDQYNNQMDQTNGIYSFKETNNKKMLLSFDSGKGIVVSARGESAGTYNYVVSYTLGEKVLTTNMTVTVVEPATSGTVTFQLESDHTSYDMTIGTSTSLNPDTITLRLAKYVAGTFTGYQTIQSACMMCKSTYYGNDMTQEGSSTYKELTVKDKDILSLTPVNMTTTILSGTSCTKATPGVYVVQVNYINDKNVSATAVTTFTLTDNQQGVTAAVTTTTSPQKVTTALALAQQCITPALGEITDCSISGSTSAGKDIVLTSGDKVHVKTVTVKVPITISNNKIIYLYQVVSIGQTLTNGK